MVAMPPLDPAVLARRGAIVAALRGIVPDGVIDDPAGLAAYESDGLTASTMLVPFRAGSDWEVIKV